VTFTPLPAHPLADLFPMLDQPDIERLADDICTFGQREPIWVLAGQVLDGRNRQAACLFADIEPVYKAYQGDDPLNFVLSLNLHRRHLTESQRAMVAAKIVDWDRGLNQATAGPANLQTREAARRLSISERAVAAAKRIHDNGSEALNRAIEEGRISVNAGEALSWLEKQEQDKVIREERKAILKRAQAIRTENRTHARKVRLEIISAIAGKGEKSIGALPRNAFPIMLADVPWEQEAWSDETGQDRGLMYPAMTIEEIGALCEGEKSPATQDSICGFWSTANRIGHAVHILERWGFEVITCLSWDKVHIGMGRWVRDQHEILLIGKRGNFPAPLPGTQLNSVHIEAKGEHSVKPEFFADWLDLTYPGVPKIELFARRARPGWARWGNQAEADEVADDGLYERAVHMVRETQKPNPAMLQRRLGILYSEASGLIERMIAEKVLPLPRAPKPAAGRKAVAA
jgi:N6-adenosine-specific RNA methylase IME4